MGEPRNPPAPILRTFPFVGAIAAGALVYSIARPGPTGVSSLGPLKAEHTAAVERGWVDAGLPRKYVLAPLAPAPCTMLGQSWKTPLVEAYGYAQEGDLSLARQVLDRYLAGSNARAAQLAMADTTYLTGGPYLSSPSDEDVLEMIDLLYLYGYVNLRNNYATDTLIYRLKRPIGLAKRLTHHRVVGRIRGEETWTRMSIPTAGGCRPTPHDLTTYHLYNNLMVGYLSTPGFHERDATKEKNEFMRDYPDDVRENPLLPIVVAPGRRRNGWLWAVSNAERVLHAVKDSLDPLQPAPWLAVNLAQVLDSASMDASPNAAQAMLDKRDELVEVALQSRSELTEDLANPLARLLLLRSIRTGNQPHLDALTQRLRPAQDSAAQAVIQALQWRHDADSLETWLARGAADSLAITVSESWLSAARWDLSSQLARRGAARPQRERAAWVRRAAAVLQPGDSAPPALLALERDRSLAGLAQRWPLLAGLATAAAVFVPLWCLAWILRRRKALWVSYYRLEARERLTNTP